MAAVFHALGKLANVIEVAPDLHMVIVDIPAGANLVFIPRIVDFHLAAIRNAKQLLVMAVNKTDSFLCVLQVLIEPIPAIAIAVQVVFASVRVQAQKIGIFFGIHTNAIVARFLLHTALGCAIAVLGKRPAVMKNVAFLTQRVDYIIKLCLELIGFQLLPEIKPAAEKAVAVCIHVCPEVPDQSGLHGNLRALAKGIFVLRLDHCSFFILDHLASPLSLAGFFSCACISFAFSKPFCAHSGSFFSSMTPRKSVR